MSPTRARTRAGLVYRYYANTDFKGRPAVKGVTDYFDKLALGSKLQPDVVALRGVFVAAP